MLAGSARLRGVLIGHGHMGRHHARHLEARSDVELVVVDPAQGLAWPAGLRPDFAVVATPTATHAEVAQPLLDDGVPCLIEKPLAHSVAAARRLEAYPHLAVGHVERFNPALDGLWDLEHRWVEAERLAVYGGRGLDMDVLDDLMVHDLDLARALLGGALRDVRASGVGVVTGSADIVNARLELGAGVANLTASRVSRRARRTLRLVGDGCYWSIDLAARAVTRVRWGDGELDGEALPVADADPLARELDAFLAMARGDAPAAVTGADGRAALELAAAVRSALAPAVP